MSRRTVTAILGVAVFGVCCHSCRAESSTLNLIELAPYASWSNSQGTFPFGRDHFYNCYAAYGHDVQMPDGTTYRKTILIPTLGNGRGTGRVTGDYSFAFPSDVSLRLRVSAVVEKGAPQTVGVGYRIAGETETKFIRKDAAPCCLDEDLALLAGRRALIVLQTEGLYSWPGWVRLTQAEIIAESGSAKLNTASCFLPAGEHAFFIRNIKGEPEQWNASRLRVTFHREVESVSGYSLQFTAWDYRGNEVANGVEDLSKLEGNEWVIRPFQKPRNGWYELTARLRRGTEVTDELTTTFSVLPKTRVLRDPVFGLNSFLDRVWVGGRTEEYKTLLRLYRDLGVGYLRLTVYYQPGRAEGFERLDAMLNDLTRQGHGVLGLFYEAKVPKEQAVSAENRISELVSRYKDRIHAWEIGNESNYTMTAEEYCEFLKICSRGIKKADPAAAIITAGLGKWGDQAYRWLEEVYTKSRDYFDCVGLHMYTHHGPIPDKDEYFFKNASQPYNRYFDLIKGHGDEERKTIWNTEYGWPATTQLQRIRQAQYVARSYLWAMPKRIPMFLFLDRNYSSDLTEEASQVGLVYRNFTPTPSCVSFAVMMSHLQGAQFVDEKKVGKNQFCYVFERDGQDFVYLWKAEGADEILTLRARKGPVVMVDIMGQVQRLKVVNGQVRVPLSTDPTVAYGLDLKTFSVLAREGRESGRRLADASDEEKALWEGVPAFDRS